MLMTKREVGEMQTSYLHKALRRYYSVETVSNIKLVLCALYLLVELVLDSYGQARAQECKVQKNLVIKVK